MLGKCKGEVRNFCLGGPSCNINIFIKTTPHTHIYTHAFFLLYTHTFLFDRLYIYTHPTNKKSLVLSIKILFDSDLS